MAYDEGLAELFRNDLAEREGITEKKMFGGVAFLDRGHMVCGVHKGGGMARVGKSREDEALALPGVQKMTFTGRPMGGFVEFAEEAMADDALRLKILGFALEETSVLPAKPPKLKAS